MSDLNKHGDRRNFLCEWCSEELESDEVMTFDLGTKLINVCEGCYEDLKSEYGLIGEENVFDMRDDDNVPDFIEYDDNDDMLDYFGNKPY